jgi:hypothetical protein
LGWRPETSFAAPGISTEAGAFQNTEPLLAELYGASTSGRIATGPRAGHKVTKAGDEIDKDSSRQSGIHLSFLWNNQDWPVKSMSWFVLIVAAV